jgi:hypothetical protein
VLAMVRELSAATADGWVRSHDVEKRVGSGGVRAALYRLREIGLVEDNGRRTLAARWRPTSKPKRSEASEPEPTPIVHRDVKPDNTKLAPKSAPEALERRTIKVEAISSRDDRFRCLPLSCTLTAGACADRQTKANGDEKANYAMGKGEKSSTALRVCKSCPLGKQVVARLAS